jgi:hypothetical protein
MALAYKSSKNMNLEITINELVPGMNGDNGLIREHWAKRKKRKDRYMWMIRYKVKAGIKFDGPVRIEYERFTNKLMDWDNHCASFKLIGDALVELGIIEDDSPLVIKEFVPLQSKVGKRGECRVVIRLSAIKDT